MKIIVCSVSCAFTLKNTVVDYLRNLGFEIDDYSLRDDGSTRPYYEVGALAAQKFQKGGYDFGIVFCGNGQGVCLAANRFEGIYAVCPESVRTTVMSRGINNANMLCLGDRVIAPTLACEMAEAFLTAQFPESAPTDMNRERLQDLYERLRKLDTAAHNI